MESQDIEFSMEKHNSYLKLLSKMQSLLEQVVKEGDLHLKKLIWPASTASDWIYLDASE